MIPPVLVVEKFTAVVVPAWQRTWSEGWLSCPVGFTVKVKDLVGPLQLTPPLVKVGVTTIVAVSGEVPVLVKVNEGMFPVPKAARPIAGVSLVQA